MADARQLQVSALLEGGFTRSAEWRLDPSGLLGCIGELPDAPGVYAFASGEHVQYVGLASASLAKRLYLYTRPGPTQRTNSRLNALLRESLARGQTHTIYTSTPPDLEWMGWRINGAAGLEAGLISSHHLPWNIAGARSRAMAPQPAGQAGEQLARVGPPTPVNAQLVHRSRNRYSALCDYLRDRGELSISMSFMQIEALVGKLPKSAYLHRAWWGNHEGNTQAQGWMPARYLAEPNPARRSVVFRRFSY